MTTDPLADLFHKIICAPGVDELITVQHGNQHRAWAAALRDHGVRMGDEIDVERLAEAMDDAFDYDIGPTLPFVDDSEGFWHPFAVKVAREYAATPEAPRDTASAYGRLLADRDRLISEGVDPDELLVPEAPHAED